MKKLLTAAVVAGLLILGGQANVDAATLNVAGVEAQDASSWTNIRDRILGRDNYKNRRDYRDDRYRDDRRRDYRDDRYRDERRKDYRDDHRRENYPPPPPPPERRR